MRPANAPIRMAEPMPPAQAWAGMVPGLLHRRDGQRAPADRGRRGDGPGGGQRHVGDPRRRGRGRQAAGRLRRSYSSPVAGEVTNGRGEGAPLSARSPPISPLDICRILGQKMHTAAHARATIARTAIPDAAIGCAWHCALRAERARGHGMAAMALVRGRFGFSRSRQSIGCMDQGSLIALCEARGRRAGRLGISATARNPAAWAPWSPWS
jgi:hypothetical protein